MCFTVCLGGDTLPGQILLNNLVQKVVNVQIKIMENSILGIIFL